MALLKEFPIKHRILEQGQVSLHFEKNKKTGKSIKTYEKRRSLNQLKKII